MFTHVTSWSQRVACRMSLEVAPHLSISAPLCTRLPFHPTHPTMSNAQQLATLRDQLKNEMSSASPNADKCNDLLARSKVGRSSKLHTYYTLLADNAIPRLPLFNSASSTPHHKMPMPISWSLHVSRGVGAIGIALSR